MGFEDPDGEHDPLAKLYRARRNVRAAAAMGDDIGNQLKDIDFAISEIIDNRAEQYARRHYPERFHHERER